jgi:hypothetical protein
MATKLTGLTHKIAIQLHLAAESCTISSSRSRWPVQKLLDTPSYIFFTLFSCLKPPPPPEYRKYGYPEQISTKKHCVVFHFDTTCYDSSVGIVLDYGLDDRGSRVRFPAGAGKFSFHHRVQNGSGAHPASYPMDIRGSFPRGKVAGA